MSRPFAALFAFFLIAAADGGRMPHAQGAPAGPGPGCGGSYTAARGDTLYSIARRCETTVTELVQENRLGQPPRLSAGRALAIPGFAGAEAAPPARTLPPRIDAPARPVRVRPTPPMPPVAPPPPRADIYYFQAGDTFYSLARWARTPLAALRAANPDVDPRDVEIGDPVRLPPGAVWPEPMRLRERGRPAPVPAVAPAPPPRPQLPPRPPLSRHPEVTMPPDVRIAPPPGDDDEADKPKPDDEDEDDGVTPGGMDDGGPEPDGM